MKTRCRLCFILPVSVHFLFVLEKAVVDIGKRFTDFIMPFRRFIFIGCVEMVDNRMAAPVIILKILHVFLQHPVLIPEDNRRCV